MKIFLRSIITLASLSLLFTTSIEAKPTSNAQIKKQIIQESINSYPGNCPCPYNRASNGSKCGKRSAWSKQGGYAPICYENEVTASMINDFKNGGKQTETTPQTAKQTTKTGSLTFAQAKKVLPQVYSGLEDTFYCGCSYSGKAVNLASCGYKVRKNENRASRIEWEHVVPAWVIGHQRQCWQNGGRKNCTSNDDVFKYAEGDLNNLVPSIGEVNGDRSNFSFSQWTNGKVDMYGKCQTAIDFKARKIQPRAEVRGRVARIYFYMSDTYGLNLSSQDTRLFCAWAKQYPVDSWELKRNARIIAIQKKGNDYVTNSSKIKQKCN